MKTRRTPEPWILVEKKPNKPSIKMVNANKAVCCDFCKQWSFALQHSTERCFKKLNQIAEQNNNVNKNAAVQANLALSMPNNDKDVMFQPTISLVMACHI